MSTKKLFGKKFGARPDRFDIRDLPYRAPLKSLPEQYPSQELIDECLPSYRKTKMVLDQGTKGSCTGFGLAAVINYLRWEPWYVASKGEGKPPLKVSKRMLEKIRPEFSSEWKEIFNKRHQNELKRWREFSEAINADRVVEEHVPPKSNGKTSDTIRADHGSFDNNLNVVNRALERILGSKPVAPVTDLRGF